MLGSPRQSASPTHRLLCAQRSRVDCDAIEALFSSCAVDCATGVATAQQWVAERLYDLYLLDYELEGGTGLMVLATIRQIDPHGPVLMYYRHATHEAVGIEAMSAGAQAFLCKPIDIMFIENAVNGLICMAQMHSIGAKVAERQAAMEAMQDDLRSTRQVCDAVQRQLLKAQEALVRAKAWLAFSTAGGTKASFENLWPEVYSVCQKPLAGPVRAG